VQLDLPLGVKIFGEFEAQCVAKGLVLDPELEMYLTPQGRRLYVAQLLNGLSRFTSRIVPGQPIQTLYKSCGDLVRMKKDKHTVRGIDGKFAYMHKGSATEIDLRIAFNSHFERAETRARADTKQTELWEQALRAFPKDTTFDEAYAAEAQAYLSRKP
jgi:hypothetical protein